MDTNKKGFTLIELMIVVGIIGILVSIAGPQFKRYQRKARQSEAKLAVGAMYSLERSFYSEYASYIPALDAIGYTPEGSRRFYAHYICYTGPWTGTVKGYSGATSVSNFPRVNAPYSWALLYTGVCNNFACGSIGNDPQYFAAYAHGNIGGSYDDVWIIDETKVMKNCSFGL